MWGRAAFRLRVGGGKQSLRGSGDLTRRESRVCFLRPFVVGAVEYEGLFIREERPFLHFKSFEKIPLPALKPACSSGPASKLDSGILPFPCSDALSRNPAALVKKPCSFPQISPQIGGALSVYMVF